MNGKTIFLAATLVLAPSAGWAQARSDAIAEQWREAKRAELSAERARIDAQITALASTPDLSSSATPIPAGDQAMAGKPPAAGGSVAGSEKAGEQPGSGTTRPFGGLNLGVGLSFTADIGKLDRISDASVVNGIVRVNDQNNGRARIMLESHYFVTPCRPLFGLGNDCDSASGFEYLDPKEARWGFGPFVAIQPGSSEIIDAIGMGIMVGARREGSSQSFNIGVGIVVDPNTRVLGDGIRENQPLPAGETEVRYRETLQTGILLLTSFSF